MNANLYTITDLANRGGFSHADAVKVIEAAKVPATIIGKRRFYPHDGLVAVMARRRWLDSEEGKQETLRAKKAAIAKAQAVHMANAAARRSAKNSADHKPPRAGVEAQPGVDHADIRKRLAALELQSNDTYSLTCTITRQVSELYELVLSIKNDNKAQGKLSMAHIAALNELMGTDDTPAHADGLAS